MWMKVLSDWRVDREGVGRCRGWSGRRDEWEEREREIPTVSPVNSSCVGGESVKCVTMAVMTSGCTGRDVA
jgi:hypothetical protein